MVQESTLDWNRVTEELAAMPPHRLKRFLQRLEKKRRELALRRGYAALAELTFDDVPSNEQWLLLENEALHLVDEKSHANT